MNNKNKTKYHTVGTVSNSNRKIVHTEVESIQLTHKYMTAHFPGSVQAFQ
jgi:hypothetical protein